MPLARITFFYSKPRANPNYSISTLFNTVQIHLPAFLQTETVIVSHLSKGIFNRLRIMWEARSKQGDINHVTGDIHFIACLLKRNRTVLTIHDCGFMNHSSLLLRFVFKWFWLILPVWRSKVVTVVSDATKKDVLKYARCKPEKIKVIPNFVSNRFKPFPKAFDFNKPTILHIGTAHNKNLDRLTEAIAGISCQLNIIGKLSESQIRLLKKYNIDYTNTYNTTDEMILESFRRCDLLCFVSTFEGFGIPILEAQTIGRPVVTSNLSAMPQIAGDGALFVNPFDVNSIRKGIISIISDAESRNKLINAGFENVKRFSQATTVNAYVEVYLKLLGSNA